MFRRTGSTPHRARGHRASFGNDAAGIAALRRSAAARVGARRDGGDRRLRAAGLPAAVGGRASPAPSSMRATCGALPRRWAFWRRPTASMPASSPASPKPSDLPPTPPPSSGPAAAEGPGHPAPPGHRRPHRPKQRSAAAERRVLASLDEVIALLKRQRARSKARSPR